MSRVFDDTKVTASVRFHSVTKTPADDNIVWTTALRYCLPAHQMKGYSQSDIYLEEKLEYFSIEQSTQQRCKYV